MKLIIVLLMLVVITITPTSLFAESFVLDSLSEANKLSKSTNKPVLVIFGSDSCAFCVLLKKSIATDLKNDIDGYIICYLDLGKNPELKKEHQISLIPDSRIVKDDTTISVKKGFNLREYKNWLQNNVR